MRKRRMAGLLAAMALGSGGVQAETFELLTSQIDRMTPGNTAFIDAVTARRIVEIDFTGRVVWECPLEVSRFGSGELQRGADLEWVAADDTFLVAVPFSGIFRVNRACEIVWEYRTDMVSHDADLLPNGNVLYTYAWDSEGDHQAVEVTPEGRAVWRWKASNHIDPSWTEDGGGRGAASVSERGRGRGQGGGRGEGFTHANAVVRLSGGDTLVSLRNFDRVVRVAPAGDIRAVYGPIPKVHDPSFLADGRLVAANHQSMMVIAVDEAGRRQPIFRNEIGIKPIRTVEQLAGGNFLVSGGEDLVEIDRAGVIVWHVRVFNGLGDRIRDGIYKAVRVGK